MELAFDMTNAGGTYVDPDPRVPNLKFFRFAFEDLSPIEIPHQYRPYFTNHEYPIDIYDPHAGYEKLFGEFIGIDRPVAGLKYHRRNGTEYDSDTINGLSREKVTVERASVFYYSGETFSYRP